MSKVDKNRDGIYTRKDRPGYWGSWIDAKGRRRQRKLAAHTLQQARTLLFAEKAKVERALTLGYAEPTTETFAETVKRFLAYQKPRLTFAGYKRELGIFDLYLLPFFSRQRLSDIRRADVERYITSRSTKAAAASIVKEFNVLKHLFARTIDWELIATNPAQGAKLPAVAEGRTRYLSPTEFKAALEAAPEWLRAPMALAAFTGMRRGEILKLAWKDVDLPNNRLYLRETKNGSLRVLALNGLAGKVINSVPRGKAGDLLFGNVNGANLSVATKRVFASIGIEDASFHSLRHTAASWLVMEGVDLYAVGQVLGHKTPRMTQRYAHLSPAYMAGAVKKLDKVFAGVMPRPPRLKVTTTLPAPPAKPRICAK